MALLPFPVVYRLSDCLAFMLFHVFRYRKTTVIRNLANSFPELDEAGLQRIARQYYRRMCEVIVETFKTVSISGKTLRKRCVFTEEANKLFDSLYQQQQSAFVVMGHHGNWEWAAASCGLSCRQPVQILYKPLANPRLNKLLLKMRQRHGLQLIPMQHAFRRIRETSDETNLTIFITDQSPVPESAVWLQFLQQETAVFTGVEKMAIKTNRPIVFLSVYRVKQGYYRVSAEMLVADPKCYSAGDITRMHTSRLEKDIIAQPETWLWSHKRWKHTRTQVAG